MRLSVLSDTDFNMIVFRIVFKIDYKMMNFKENYNLLKLTR